MDKDLLVICKCLKSFRRVLAWRVVEESSAYSFPYLCVLFHMTSSTGYQRQFKSVHNLQQLFTDILSSLNCSCLNEIVIAPLSFTTILFPSFIDGQHSQVVTVFMIKARSFLICELLLLSRTVEYVLNWQHRHYGDNLIGATKVNWCQHHFGKLGLHREFGHYPAKLCKKSFVIQGSQTVKHFHGWDKGLDGWWIHEIKIYEVVDSHRFEN